MGIVGTIIYSDVQTPVFWADSLTTTVPTNLSLNGGEYGQAFGINSLGHIVGFITYSDVQTPVFWADSSPTTVPTNLSLNGGGGGVAQGINSLGQIVGFISYGSTEQKPVFWADSSPTTVPTNLSLNGESNGRAYGINSLGQIVGAIGYSDGGVPTPVFWADSSPSTVPTNLSLNGGDGGYAYGINSLGQIVGLIGYSDVGEPVFWADSSPTTVPTNLSLNGGSDGIAHGISDPPTPTPTPSISNICFPAGTEITTDQGDVAIEKIVPGQHTIQGKAIDFITQTVTSEPYLIKLNKHAFGQNKPSKTTLMSKDHKIAFEGQLVPAYRFLDYTAEVKKVRYTGERLYNVLMKDYGVMRVHNLTCETLDPSSPIACKYLGIAYKEKTPERKKFL